MKKVIIIRTSSNYKGNTNLLADEFKKGLAEAGNQVVDIRLPCYKINYCMGCYGTDNPEACTLTRQCWQKDDVNEIVGRMKEADVVVFASPVYFYSLSGQMKVFLDRTVQFYGGEYNFQDIYFISSSESGSKSAIEPSIQSLKGWMACMPATRLSGVIYGTGALAPGSINNRPEVLSEAYDMGKNV